MFEEEHELHAALVHMGAMTTRNLNPNRRCFMIRFDRSIIMVCLMVATLVGAGVVGATTTANPLTIDLAKAVYFPTPGGEDVMVGPGTYTVEATEQGLRLTPTDGKPEEAKLIQTNTVAHLETLEMPKVVSESVTEDNHRVLLLQVDGNGLEAIGSYSGVRSRGESYNTAMGTNALKGNSTGGSNSAFGYSALVLNQTGNSNTAVGTQALRDNRNGSYNVAVGGGALQQNTGGSNTAVGTGALQGNTTGNSNTAVGTNTLRANGGGNHNVAVGGGALEQNTGSGNTALGTSALNKNREGQNNTAVGVNALRNTTNNQNTAVGAFSLEVNTNGIRNTAIGDNALGRNQAGEENTAVGSGALMLNNANGNTGVGVRALLGNTDGGGNAAVGYAALGKNLTSRMNTALGYKALSEMVEGTNNTAIGWGTGGALIRGNNNLYIENMIGAPTESNTIRIGRPLAGNLRHDQTFIAGISGVPVSGAPVVVNAQGQLGVQGSSYRFKDHIQDMGEASQDLHKLRPVTFRYKPELAGEAPPREYGLIAEEVAKVYPDLVGHDPDGKIVTVKYHELIPMLLNEVQTEHKTVQELIRQNQEQLRQIQALMARVTELERHGSR
jgi:trimeric autotransporter adhesin